MAKCPAEFAGRVKLNDRTCRRDTRKGAVVVDRTIICGAAGKGIVSAHRTVGGLPGGGALGPPRPRKSPARAATPAWRHLGGPVHPGETLKKAAVGGANALDASRAFAETE